MEESRYTLANSKSFLSVFFSAVKKFPYMTGKTISAEISTDSFSDEIQKSVRIIKEATGTDFMTLIKVPKKISQK